MNDRNHITFAGNGPAGDSLLESLLDRALAPGALPGGLPTGLNQRILDRTLPLLGQEPSTGWGVLGGARLREMFWGQRRVLALAACVAVAVGAGLWFEFQPAGPVEVPSPAPASQPPADTASSGLAATLSSSSEIEGELASLSVRVDQVSQQGYFDFAGSDTDRTMNDLSQIMDVQNSSDF